MLTPVSSTCMWMPIEASLSLTAQREMFLRSSWRGKLIFKKIFWPWWVFIAICGLSLVTGSTGYSLVVVHGLLTAVASNLCSVVAAPWLQSTGLVVEEHRLTCSAACGTFLDQRWVSCLLHRQVDRFFTTKPLGKPRKLTLILPG